MRDIQALRTLLQHHLDPNNRSDAATLEIARRWFSESTGQGEILGSNFWPTSDKDWSLCEEQLNRSGNEFLTKISNVVAHISSDEFKRDTLKEWVVRCSRVLPPYVFDKLIKAAIKGLGLPFLDPVRIRNHHYQNWNARLRLMGDAADLTREAELIVYATLLLEWDNYCPVSGHDVITRLGITPGPDVGKILLRARNMWREQPCSADELLIRLSGLLRREIG